MYFWRKKWKRWKMNYFFGNGNMKNWDKPRWKAWNRYVSSTLLSHGIRKENVELLISFIVTRSKIVSSTYECDKSTTYQLLFCAVRWEGPDEGMWMLLWLQCLRSCGSGTGMAPQASIPMCGEVGGADVQQCVIRVQRGLCSERKGPCGVRGCSGRPCHLSCEAGAIEQQRCRNWLKSCVVSINLGRK